MTKKLFVLISTCVGAVGTIASSVVTYVQPTHAVAIVAAVGIGTTAIIEILELFVSDK